LVDKDDTQETDDVEFEQLLQWGCQIASTK
jgi:hypothetical protein